jgi:hypothetical protein
VLRNVDPATALPPAGVQPPSDSSRTTGVHQPLRELDSVSSIFVDGALAAKPAREHFISIALEKMRREELELPHVLYRVSERGVVRIVPSRRRRGQRTMA